MKAKFFTHALIAAIAVLLLPVIVQAYSFDIDSIYYSDSNLTIDYGFEGGSYGTAPGWPHPHVGIPNSAVSPIPDGDGYAHAWESIHLDGSIDYDSAAGLFGMSLQPNFFDHNIVALGGGGPLQGVSTWTYSAIFTNFDMPAPGQFHGPTLNVYGGDSTPWDAEIHAYWFTNGAPAETGLRLTAEIGGFESYHWESDEIYLFGVDPTSTDLGLKIDLANGNEFLASYSMDGGDSWSTLAGQTVVGEELFGYGSSYPGVVQEAGDIPTPAPAALWLLGSGLMGLVGLRRRFRK